MRYRPFGRASMAVSALSLVLDGEDDERSAADWRELVHAAFEQGVNSFEIVRPSPAILQGVAEGAAAVARHLLFVTLRVQSVDDPAQLARDVADVIGTARLGRIDLLNVEASEDMPRGVPAVMRALRDQKIAAWLGVAGAHDLVERHVAAGGYDAVTTDFNLLSGWRERHLLRTAMDRQLAVVGCHPFPPHAAELADQDRDAKKKGWFAKPSPLAGVGSYAFLQTTPGWDPEQICLAYALTEPSLATIQVAPEDPEHLQALAEIVERDLPPATGAQIEMARFRVEHASGDQTRKRARSA
jgi:aryl-alcohol dehydrogenase-like predicted oxidoreductase